VTEDEARAWLEDVLHVPRETLDRVDLFLNFLKDEATRQNLVSRSTIDLMWSRHVVDSAQLVPLAPAGAGDWVDLGSGAGFPGLIVAAITERRVSLIEERRKRVEFLTSAAAMLGLHDRATIIASRAEQVAAAPFAVISARAFAPLDRLFAIGARFCGPDTVWLLPKGRNAQAELDAVSGSWQGDFELVPSVTDPDSAIVVARNVRPREQR
jgi:16S rRNA (guanine527-N7)-methyltransferase